MSDVISAPVMDLVVSFKEIMASKQIKYSRSTERVYRVLKESCEPLKSIDLADKTKLTDRTVRTALRKLYDANLIRRVPCFKDMRSHYHSAL